MSGSWIERAEARQPPKPGDVAEALRDLAAAKRSYAAAVAALNVRPDGEELPRLATELDALRQLVASLDARLAKCEGPTPVKAAKAARPEPNR